MNPCPTPVNQRHPLFKKKCLLLAALGLHCCAKAVSVAVKEAAVCCSNGGCSLLQRLASHRGGFPLRSMGSRVRGSLIVAHRLSCPTAYRMFPDQG